MYTRETQALARMSGLLPDWSGPFGANGIAIQKTDGNDSDRSVADTVALMARHAREASGSVQVKQALLNAGVQGNQSEDEVLARVFSYIKSTVRFVQDEEQLEGIFQDPSDKELLITPPVLLGMLLPKGDCDDFSMLACSMLTAKGIQCDFVTVAANSNNPREFSHVYCMVRTRDGRSIPFDASHGKSVGWETERATRKQVWPVFNWGGRGSMVNGLGDFWDDIGAGDASQGGSIINTQPIVNGGGFNWGSVIPGLFQAGEKIGVQLTQQPGYQTTGPNGVSTSYVLPGGASASGILNIPGMSAGSLSSSSILIIAALGIGALLLFKGK